MIASIASPASATSASVAAPPRVASVQISFGRDETLHLGGVVGPMEGYASFDDALSGAAGLSSQVGNALAVKETGGRFQAHALLQPVWRSEFFGEQLVGFEATNLDMVNSYGEARARTGKYLTSDYGGIQTDGWRTGTVVQEDAGVSLVGPNWAMVNGSMRQVEPTMPIPPTPSPTPAPTPTPSPTPAPGGSTLVKDVTEAARLAAESLRVVNTVPAGDKGDPSTKDVRIKAFNTNMAAQKRIEQQFGTGIANVESALREADASLEDANWQLAKKPSPDGRFNGVDIPGAQRDTQRAVDLLSALRDQLVKDGAAADVTAPVDAGPVTPAGDAGAGDS